MAGGKGFHRRRRLWWTRKAEGWSQNPESRIQEAPAFTWLRRGNPSSFHYDATGGGGDDSPHLGRFQFFILTLGRRPNGITIQPDGDDLGVHAKARRDFF